jgi:hypothetical protein
VNAFHFATVHIGEVWNEMENAKKYRKVVNMLRGKE